MSNSPAPTNYQWIGNNLTFDIDPEASGVRVKYQKEGSVDWLDLVNSPNQPVSSCILDSSEGPNGIVCGATKEKQSTGGGWGDETCYPIENQ